MRQYPKYKDSGVEWIGEIPEDWTKSKLKYESNVFVQYGINCKSEDYCVSGIRFIRTTDISDDGKISDDGVYLPFTMVSEEYITKRNDLLISRSGTLGRTYLHLIDDKYCYGGYLVRFNFGNEIKSKFIFYYSKSTSFNDWVKLNTIQSTIGNVNGDKYSNMEILLPPLHIQNQINTYLDEKTSIVDSLIQKKQRKIDLLKEQRTSIINQVVTKGLNPNVKMKESGVEWIGEIPEGWNTIRMKYLCDMVNDKDETTESDIKVSPENVESYTGICFNLYSEYTGVGIRFRKGDVLFNKLRLYLVKILLTDYEGFSMGEMIVLRPRHIFNKYLFYVLFNQGLINLLDSQSTGVKLPRVSPEVILGSFLPSPPTSEQIQIVDYLDITTSKIDDQINLENKKIDLLKEYRQSLISEVVTGKIDVRKN